MPPDGALAPTGFGGSKDFGAVRRPSAALGRILIAHPTVPTVYSNEPAMQGMRSEIDGLQVAKAQCRCVSLRGCCSGRLIALFRSRRFGRVHNFSHVCFPRIGISLTDI